MTDQTINAPSLTEYSSLGSYLQSFSDITQIDALFYSLTGVLVHNNNVYSDDKIIQSELDVNKIVKYTIFPIILDSKLLGFVLCNCDNVSQQRVKLSKEYLNNIFTQVFDEEGSGKQVVLDALSNEQFGQINYLSILLKLSFRYSNVVEEQVDKQVTASSEASKSLKKAIDYILKNINKSFSLNDLADKVYLSPSYLSRLFKKDLHITFIDYVNHLKVAKAKEKLALTNQPVSSIALSVGFSQTSYFTKTFKKMAKTTPSKFRDQYKGTERMFTIPHTIDWDESSTVFEVSKKYFQDKGIDFFYQSGNNNLYVNSIDNLTDSAEVSGWLFTVDGLQPDDPVNRIKVTDVSEIQWIYTEFKKR